MLKNFSDLTPAEIKAMKLDKPMKKSPVEQKGKQVQLSVHEKKKGTMITGGSKSEVINDLEDRIEFLNSDLQDSDSALEKGQIKTQLSKLNIRLKKERAK